MKFSLKTLAVAVALAAAAGSASAAINDGSNGNGELFFNAWDGKTSYVYDMNLSIDDYLTQKSAAGSLNLKWGSGPNAQTGSGDFTSTYDSWLATANKSTLEWSVLAVDASGARRYLATVGQTTLPATNKAADVIRSSITDTQVYLAQVNGAIGSNNSLVTTSNTSATYAGKIGAFVFTKFNFDTTGSFANNSYATGAGFEMTTANATGITAGLNTAQVDGTAVRSWVDAQNNLHIAAVPEPSEYALLLAGLGLMGAIARRRKNARI